MRYIQDEEQQIASRYLFLSMAITVIRQDLYHIQEGPFKIKNPYYEILRKMEHQARLERKNLHQFMQEKKIQVIFLQKNHSFASYLFITKEHEEQQRYFIPAIRKKVEEILFQLMRKALQPYRRGSSIDTEDVHLT